MRGMIGPSAAERNKGPTTPGDDTRARATRASDSPAEQVRYAPGMAQGGDGRRLFGRRRLLKAGLVLGGAVAGGAGGAWAWLKGTAPDVEGLRCLDDAEYRTLAKLVEVLFPSGASIEVDVGAMDLPRAVDGFLADEPADRQSDLRAALFLLEVAPVVDQHRATTFSRLGVSERDALFRQWMEGDDPLRRKITVAFRKLLGLLFYDREEVWPFLGYPGPSLGARGGAR